MPRPSIQAFPAPRRPVLKPAKVLAALAWAGVVLSVPAAAATAQTKPAAAPAAPAPPATAATAGAGAADPQTVLAHINDLGLLKALQPLRLTEDQITKLLAVMRAVAETGRARAKQEEAVVRAFAADVARAHADALAGAEIPVELEKRVETAGKEATERQRQAKNAAVGRILAVAKAVLTPAQRDQIEAQSRKAFGGRIVPREYRDNPSKAPREAVLDLATGAFIDRVLLNDRAIEVLSRMKPAPVTPTATPGATPPAAPAATPPAAP